MPDFVPQATARWKGTYRVGGVQHVLGLRFARSSTAALVQTNGATLAEQIFDSAASRLYSDFAWIKAEYALADEVIFQPASLPSGSTGVIDPATDSATQRVMALNFAGKGVQSKARVYIYGVVYAIEASGIIGADSTITAAEDSVISSIVNALNSANLVAIDDTPAVFYQQATYKVNDFLLRRVRRGTIT